MRILVAEDHPSLARSIADGLRDEGYAVDLTFDGNEALHLAGSNPYDMIILDIMLPGRDGFSIIQVLRRRDVQIPILCLTSRDGIVDRVKGLDLGADDYLVKPFAWEELSARVRSMVRRGHGQKSTVITVGDLEIDTAKKLAQRQGQVVSRSDIWEHLYDQHDETTSNVVDVYIGYLRNKIDKDFEVKLIHTRRGQGYLLGVES